MINDNKEKMLINIAIFLVIIILIIIIYLIWNPFFSSDKGINTYDSSISYQETMEQYYREYLSNNLKITNFDNLYDYIDKNYIESFIGNDSKENVEQYLRDNNLISMDITIENVEAIEDGYNYIYRISYIVHNMRKYVNIVESRPYIFKLSFEQDNLSSLNNNNFNFQRDNIEYKFEVMNSNDTSIRYKLTITNNSANNIKYDFSNLNSIQIITNENYINMALIANSSTNDYSISSGSTKSIEILFNIPFSDQANINGFKLNNVAIGNETSESIELKP